MGFSDKLYEDMVYYSNYANLASCIYYNRLSEGYLNDGACDLRFCTKNPRNKKTKIIKINVVPEDRSGTGFIAVDDKNKEIIVSFRGSTTWKDWQTDFNIGYSDYRPISDYVPGIPACGDGCKVHSGFYHQLESITEEILKPVEDLYLKYKDYRLVVIGHSLGGAFATIIGIEFRVRGFTPLVVTYGMPRIFNEQLKTWVNSIFNVTDLEQRVKNKDPIKWGFIRVSHENDYVPDLPMRMSHAGVQFHITKRDLPHEKNDVIFIGSGQEETPNQVKTITDPLHGYEHRTYFLTINKCLDDISIQQPEPSLEKPDLVWL
ncbi:hypothetical protein WICPIJ_008560 [Wickerhamomyces pijperi]|uniref:triacylglycerol lipase n=1 Tax=Wickerhamomyces pijperi TaxID=599730 RepID=A0A9P8THH1_WICPI|nr:hypothetical protein WICPIJ_008560 [Wickerhamomyces pijperi]